MKKTFAVIAAVLFVMSFAASAFAIHAEIPAETQAVIAKGETQITLGGQLRVRGRWGDNLSNGLSGLPHDANPGSLIQERVRLNLGINQGNVSGMISLQTKEENYLWGGTSTAGPNGAQRSEGINLLEAWIQYTGSGLLGFNSGIKAGHQYLLVGAGHFFDHTLYGDDAIVLYADPSKETHLGLVYIKFSEGSAADNTDDIDGYTALVTQKLGNNNTLDANYTYVNQSDTKLKLHNLGVSLKGEAAGFGYKVSGDIQFGSSQPVGATEETDYAGWAITAGVNYKVNPAVNLRAAFYYGSGDDDKTDDENNLFQTFQSSIGKYTFVYDYRVITAATGASDTTGVAGTTYYNLGLDYSPMKEMNISLDAWLLRASEQISSVSNTVGHDKDIGWEVDAKFTYKLAKNLLYFWESGVLFAGDFYKTATNKPKNASFIQHGIVLSF